ncbi:MAG: winged helix-turn-helix domain-containing protein [Lachnospiraceae bacterium]|nr:winged helix-turn-helix domain-containing protein [Lachnospiraceae bacterium]
MKEGEKRGIIKILRELVDDGTLSITDAAKRSGMSAAAFKAAIKNI